MPGVVHNMGAPALSPRGLMPGIVFGMNTTTHGCDAVRCSMATFGARGRYLTSMTVGAVEASPGVSRLAPAVP